MDDEIFQGVSFAAVKEQLHLLGHDLPDDVILAYLTEGSAAEPTQSAPEEHSGRHCSIGEPDYTSCSSADCHSDLSAEPAKHWDRTSSESYSLRRSCVEEELLSAVTLTEVGKGPQKHNKMIKAKLLRLTGLRRGSQTYCHRRTAVVPESCASAPSPPGGVHLHVGRPARGAQ